MPQRPRYPQGEIATVARDFIVPTYGSNRLQPQDEVLISRGGGGWAAYDIYSDIAKDAHLAAVLGKRYGAVVGREWEVKPGDDSAKAQKAADMVRDMLVALADRGQDEEGGEALITTSSGFDAVSLGLLSATLYGFQPAEIIWDKSDKLIYPSEIKIKDLRRFGFIAADRGYKPRLLTWQNQFNGEPIPPRKFIFHRFCALPTEDPYGLGLGGRVFFPVFFKRNAVKFWLTFADKFASPTLVGKYPNGTKEADRDILLDALKAFASEAGVAIPTTMEVGLVEAARSSSVGVYDGLVDFCNREISKVILGETGSTDQQGSGGSRARDQVGNEVRIEVAKMDADMLSECLNRTLVKWIVQLNLGNDVPLPKVWRKFPELENKLDRVAEAGVISSLVTAGFKPTREWVSERLEVELEDAPAEDAPGSGGPGLDELLNGGLGDEAEIVDEAPPETTEEEPAPELSEALDFGSIVDRVIPYQELKIGVEYLPGQVRFPKRRNSKKLRSGYGHIRGYKGADGEALDCYLASAFFVEGETPTDLIFEIRQLAMDGDFDEHKFMLGYADQKAAKAAYLQELPSEFFGGIRAVDRADLEQYRKPVEMSEGDADGYGISVGDRNCGNCLFSRTARPDGTGWLNCDKYDFETAATEVCYAWESKAANMAERADDRDIVDEYTDQAAPKISGEIRAWTDRISRSLDAAVDLEEFRDKLFDLYDELPPAVFAELMGQASISAQMAGRFEVVSEHESASGDVELAEEATELAVEFADAHGEIWQAIAGELNFEALLDSLSAPVADFAAKKVKGCTPGKSHQCGGACVPLTKKCQNKAAGTAKVAADYVATKAGGAKADPVKRTRKPKQAADKPETKPPAKPKADVADKPPTKAKKTPIDSVSKAATESLTIQAAAAKSTRVSQAVDRLKAADEKMGAPVREKIRNFMKKNPGAVEDMAVSALAMAGQFALMPNADLATASILQGAIGVVARSGMRGGKRIKDELKADPKVLKSGKGILGLSRKVLSDFKGAELREKLIGDAIGPVIASASGAAVGGGLAGAVVGTAAAVKGVPKAATLIRQGLESTGNKPMIEAPA